MLHQVKAMDVPAGKLRDKGTPIDNLSKFDGAKETIVYLTCARGASRETPISLPRRGHGEAGAGGEFMTNNRMVAATKLPDGDELVCIPPVNGERRRGDSDRRRDIPAVYAGGDFRAEEKFPWRPRHPAWATGTA